MSNVKKTAAFIDNQMRQIEQKETRGINLIQLIDNHYYVLGFPNVGVVITHEGIVVIDTHTSNAITEEIYKKIREKTDLPIRYIIYTHGHWDHVNSTHILKEKRTQVIGHENVLDRFYKYKNLNEYQLYLNNIQYQGKLGIESYEFISPDITFEREFQFVLGGKTFNIIHGKGETDDHCFVHVLEDNVIYAGDFVVGSFPNIGNPLKVNRFEREWYETLEKMISLHPNILVPGHGEAIFGQEDVEKALNPVIEALKFIHVEVLKCLNKGLSIEEALEVIRLPRDLESSNRLNQHYGSVYFAIKGTYRRYTGWFDGNPTNLRPAKAKDVASEILSLVKDTNTIIDRCRNLMKEEKYQMVLHLTDILIESENNTQAKQLKKEALQKLADTCPNFIMRNIYSESGLKI